MAIHRGDDGRECVVLKPKESFNMEEFAEAVKKQLAATGKLFEMAMVDLVPVVHCKDCEYCNPLYFDPNGNYAGDGSFTCGETEIDYYAPDYHMDTFYCADGKRREAGVRED